MADTRRLAEHFAAGDSIFVSSALYRSLCRTVAGDQPVLDLLVQRRPGQQPSFLLFGAVHYLLLSGAAHPLGGYYPSLHGAAAADPSGAGPALLDFCRAYRDELAELIRTRLVQTNVVKRSAGLRIALWAVGQRCARPVHLVEVGASAAFTCTSTGTATSSAATRSAVKELPSRSRRSGGARARHPTSTTCRRSPAGPASTCIRSRPPILPSGSGSGRWSGRKTSTRLTC